MIRPTRLAPYLAALVAALAAVVDSAQPAPALAQGGFVIVCDYSHTLPDDPIVFPGQPGASHSHDFFANESTDADSTYQSMTAAKTDCGLVEDTAGYWVPTPMLGDREFHPSAAPHGMRIYYQTADAPAVEPIPPDLKAIGGDKTATAPAPLSEVRWYCGAGPGGRTSFSTHPYDCTWYANRYSFVDGVVGVVDLPRCWDGEGLEPANLAYPLDGGADCPPAFPHVLPLVSERVHFGIMDPCAGATPCGPNDADANVALGFMSGPYYTFHADFWNTWHQDRLQALTVQCLNAHVHCGFLSTHYTLTVGMGGAGSGRVSNRDGTIDCGDVCSNDFRAGREVTLVAQPDHGSAFMDWHGDCASRSPTCRVAMESARNVTAEFGPGVYRPDAAIRAENGADGEAAIARIHRERTTSFFIRIRNDGNTTDGFAVHGPAGRTGFQVRYRAGRIDVTSRVTDGTYSTGPLGPHEARVIRLVVNARRTARISSQEWLVSARSTTQRDSRDAVRAVVRVVAKRTGR